MTTWEWPTHWRELGHGRRAELLDGADCEGGAAVGVGVEVVGVDQDVELDLAGGLGGARRGREATSRAA